jgi:membrane associated rhomboid family serine protease
MMRRTNPLGIIWFALNFSRLNVHKLPFVSRLITLFSIIFHVLSPRSSLIRAGAISKLVQRLKSINDISVLGLDLSQVFSNWQVWRLWSSHFLYFSDMHMWVVMLSLAGRARQLEEKVGSHRMAALLIALAATCNFVVLGVQWSTAYVWGYTDSKFTRVAGASVLLISIKVRKCEKPTLHGREN